MGGTTDHDARYGHHGRQPRAFLSYARSDGSALAGELQSYMSDRPYLESFLDRTKIPKAGLIEDSICDALRKTDVFVALLTDDFVESTWTLREMGWARGGGEIGVPQPLPFVALDVLSSDCARLPAALANAPFMRVRPDVVGDEGELDLVSRKVAALVLVVFLRSFLHRAETERAQELSVPNSKVGGGLRVEPLSYAEWTPGRPQPEGTILVYPDPPLLEVELATTGATQTASTLSQYVANRGRSDADFQPRAKPARIGITCSLPRDLADAGITGVHTDRASLVIARMALFLGANLAYGGDLRRGGFAESLVDMVKYYAAGRLAREALHHFLAWPIHFDWKDEDAAERDGLARVERFGLPEGLEADGFTRGSKEGRHLLVWAKSLTAMRRKMIDRCDARVLLGGPLSGYKGRLPGIVEEGLLAVQAEQPIYLISGFGGAARALFQAVRGNPPEQFKDAWQTRNTHGIGDVYRALDGTEDHVDWEEIVETLQAMGLEGLSHCNGLTVAENIRLGTSLELNEIVYLLAKGMTNAGLVCDRKDNLG